MLTGFASWLHYCSDVAYRRPTKLCMIIGPLLGWYTMYTFLGLLSSWRNFVRVKFTLRPSLAFSYIGSVMARHSSSGLRQTLRRGARNGITELSQEAPPIFGWAAVTLVIDPHYSVHYFSLFVPCCRLLKATITSVYFARVKYCVVYIVYIVSYGVMSVHIVKCLDVLTVIWTHVSVSDTRWLYSHHATCFYAGQFTSVFEILKRGRPQSVRIQASVRWCISTERDFWKMNLILLELYIGATARHLLSSF